MKKTLSILLLPLLTLNAGLRSQESKPPVENPRPVAEGDRPFRHGGPGGPSGEKVDRPLAAWLDKRKEQNPEEFERLKKMREENPQEFRRHLVARLSQERVRRSLDQFPEIRSALEKVPEDKKREFFLSLTEWGPPPGEAGPVEGQARPSPGGDKRELPVEVKELVRKYRTAASETEKNDASRELRGMVAEFYTKRLVERQGHLERMEQDLLRMRREMDEQNRNRDKAVEERVKGLLEI